MGQAQDSKAQYKKLRTHEQAAQDTAGYATVQAPYGRDPVTGRPYGYDPVSGTLSDETLSRDMQVSGYQDLTQAPKYIEEGETVGVPEWAQEQVNLQGDTGYDPTQWDPRAMDAQQQALSGMQDIYQQGGMTAIDRQRQAQQRGQEDAWMRGQRESALQNMQARGMGGSGMELLAQLKGQESAGMRANQAALGTESMALQRRDQALAASGDLGARMRLQQAAEAQEQARAQDAINKFNTTGRRDVEERRAGQENQGRTTKWNLDEQRRVRVNQGKNREEQDRYGAGKDKIAAGTALSGSDVGYGSLELGNRQQDQAEKFSPTDIFSSISGAFG